MLSEFDNIERSAGADKAADLRRALHFLLRRQFVFAGDPRTGTVYNIIMDGRFRDVVDGFFDSCGYRVHRDPEAQWAGILALDEDVPLPRMRLDETGRLIRRRNTPISFWRYSYVACARATRNAWRPRRP